MTCDSRSENTRIVQKMGFEAKFSKFKIRDIVGGCDIKFLIRLEGLAVTSSLATNLRWVSDKPPNYCRHFHLVVSYQAQGRTAYPSCRERLC